MKWDYRFFFFKNFVNHVFSSDYLAMIDPNSRRNQFTWSGTLILPLKTGSLLHQCDAEELNWLTLEALTLPEEG